MEQEFVYIVIAEIPDGRSVNKVAFSSLGAAGTYTFVRDALMYRVAATEGVLRDRLPIFYTETLPIRELADETRKRSIELKEWMDTLGECPHCGEKSVWEKRCLDCGREENGNE